jgi:hypothetical protein
LVHFSGRVLAALIWDIFNAFQPKKRRRRRINKVTNKTRKKIQLD